MGWGLSCRSVLRMSDEQPPVPEADFLRSPRLLWLSVSEKKSVSPGPRASDRSLRSWSPGSCRGVLHVACAAVPEPRAGRLAAGAGSAAPGDDVLEALDLEAFAWVFFFGLTPTSGATALFCLFPCRHCLSRVGGWRRWSWDLEGLGCLTTTLLLRQLEQSSR